MAHRLNSLKTRTALAIASVIVVILVANALYLTLAKRAELREEIEEKALNFALLTRHRVGAAYDADGASAPERFQDLTRETLQLNPDVKRALVLDAAGETLFDSAGPGPGDGTAARPRAQDRIEESRRAPAIERREPTILRGRDPSGEEILEIVAPYVDARGGRRLFVAYQFSYKSLNPRLAGLLYATVGLTLVSILLSALVAAALASRITRPLKELTDGAREIAEGNFDRRLAIRSRDELQILAETFNHMAARLKENVEKLEESNRKLAEANEELKELDRMKSDLLANVSHELRTPLTAIKGYTDYILERKLGAVTDKQEKGLIVMQRNLDRLSKSIGALLEFSRLEGGPVALNVQPFNLSALVEQVHTLFRSELDRRRLSFAAEIEPGLPSVTADREKIAAVLENLVVNAMKFTPPGGRITVNAALVRAGGRPAAEIKVADTGVGIPRDQMGKIFNRFHQVDGSTTRRFGGVGLGLAIVKSLLEAHASSISAESEEGQGASFRFTLPVAEKGEVLPAGERGRPGGGLLLVVDDDPRLARALRGDLEEDGFSVLTAATAAEGAALAAERRPDAILLNLLLPDRSGLELLHGLKGDPATRRIPLLAISAANQIPKALPLGAADYLNEPADRSAVASTLRRLLERSGGAEPTVLVVDDEPDTANRIRDALGAEGFRPQVAHDLPQALELIGRRRPDAVVLDVMMPGQWGFTVLETLGMEEIGGLPPLVLTAPGEEKDARPGPPDDRRSPDEPTDMKALVAAVRRYLGRQDHREGARQASL